MDATALHVVLELDARDWTLVPRYHSAVCGQQRLPPIPLPFSADDLAIIERLLDLNECPGVEHAFSASELGRLTAWGLLRQPPADPAGASLSGRAIHRDRLRAQVRTWLADLLLIPLAAPIDQHFAVQRAKTGGQRPLLYLRLEFWPGDLPLLRLPWELLHRHRLVQGDVQIGRYLLYPSAVGLPPPAPDLRLLVLHSDPVDVALPRLDLKDRERIGAGLQGTPGAHRIAIDTLAPASLTGLREALHAEPGRPTIVHLAGHGDFGWRCERCRRVATDQDDHPCGQADCGFVRDGAPAGFLAFTDPRTGAADWIGSDGLCEALRRARDLRLVVLNTCKSATARGGPDVFNGIAQRLMDLVPAVIASPYPLENRAAEAFARGLYQALGEGLTLVDSMHQVRLAMAESFSDEWYRPVLYLRSSQDDGGRVLEVPAEPTPGHPHDAVPSGGAPTTAGPDPRRESRERALAALAAQYDAALMQSVTAIDAVTRVKAARQVQELEQQMRAIERTLAGGG